MARKSKVMGVAELSQRLKAIPKEARKASYAAAIRAAERMAADMRAMVPDETSPYGTGNLKDTIVVTKGGEKPPSYSQGAGNRPIPENAVAVTAGDTFARHAHLVEFGTSRAPAQPFFLPAVRSNRPKARRAINSAISRAIKKAK